MPIFVLFFYFVFACNACWNLLLEGVAILCCIVVMSFYGYYRTMCSKLYFLEEKLGGPDVGPEGVQIEGSTFLTDLFTRLEYTAYGHKKASF